MRSLSFYTAFVFCFSVFFASQTVAETNRDKIVQVIIPAPAGGQPDVLGRQIIQKLEEKTGETFLVMNKPGATGIIGNNFVAKAFPDGNTLLITPKSYITNTPHVHRKMPYDSLSDLVPIIQTGAYEFALVSNLNVPAKTVKELIALAKMKPEFLTFGSPGVGNSLHISGELFQQMAGVKMVHIPFTGAPAALNALVGGHIDLAFSSILAVKSFADAGKLRIIAVTGHTRNPLLPNIPTIDESGLPGYEMIDWNGMFAPKGTSLIIVEHLNVMVHDILMTQEMRDLWESQGVKFTPNTPTQFKTIVKDDYDRSGKLIRTIGINPG